MYKTKSDILEFYVLLTVHLDIILANNQLDEQFFFLFVYFNSLHVYIRGSFQKFCTLYIFSLKTNLFYKIHLQTFNVISIVLHHCGPTFGKVLYSCQDAFVVDASDYSGHLIRHLLNASEAFPTEWFLQFWE
jgi:hypothetical protein